ncbi:ATP-binding protein [Zoogloea sp.]|uniref:sensor histidine kinase n=1 Tax=Zoogloea sp. TaxID=49181 RepID=UPI0035AD7799
MIRRVLARFTGSVRAKLLAMVLAPLFLGVPILLGLVWLWGNDGYHRLLSYKVGSDLVTAHEYFGRMQHTVAVDLGAVAGSQRLSQAMAANSPAALADYLDDARRQAGLDFLFLLDSRGRPLGRQLPEHLPRTRRTAWPVVNAALAGSAFTAIDVFDADHLAAIDPALARRCRLPLLPTPNAAPDKRSEETRGLLIHVAIPVRDSGDRLVGVLEGGVLLNGNTNLVDSLNTIIYRDGTLPLGSQGTATLFLGDTRIATNVRLFGERRALGTRASQAVRDHVLNEGKTWLDTAFVVNDYYVSGYEPVVDSFGERVGMLYVGFLEAPFSIAMRNALLTLFVVFIGVSLAGSVLSLRWARGIFKPLEKVNATIRRIGAGDADARVGPVASRDEIGLLAAAFDELLDNLAARRAELQRWGDELDRKVAERTQALQEALATLEQARRHLAMTEKLAAIGELTAGVAHEINNPVAVIQGNLDVLKEILGPAAEPVREEIRLIHEQTHRIWLIVTKLLQFARPGEFAGYSEAIDPAPVIADCLVLTRHNLDRRNITVQVDNAATCRIEVNTGELQQVLINLIVNAIQAMPDGGTLSISTRDWADEHGDTQGAAISVCDTGHGIAAEDLSRIFDPFFTTKKGSGTGLGLSISYAIVERYGGRIEVSSRPGEGACFTIQLRREARYADTPSAPGFTARRIEPGTSQSAG